MSDANSPRILPAVEDYSDVVAMPTIHQGQYDDLKYEDLSRGIRVWLSRVEPGTATIECLTTKGWRVTRTIRKDDE